MVIQPFFDRLSLAQAILCSVETDFIYAVHPASGVVYVARAENVADVDGWTAREKAIFQMAQPDVKDVDGWVLHADLAEAVASTVLARVHPNRTRDLQDSVFEPSVFGEIVSMSTYSVSEGAHGFLCSDLDVHSVNSLVLFRDCTCS